VNSEREFTVEEANLLLESLAETINEIRKARQVVLSGAERMKRSAGTDGGPAHGQDYWDALATLRREVEGLAEEGIILRDPQAGVVDFPSRREGRKVLLCWKVGESRVGYWHPPESGFAGRRPL
jgi:hypothetical protein